MLPLLASSLLLVAGTVSAQLGPGAGPWQTATPESQGLDAEQLRLAEERVNEQMGDRLCYLVIKNGLIVHETYRRGHTESSLHAGWSTTKTLCAGLYGVAVEQGWASVEDLVRERNGGDTRQCNADATFRTVLSMTGRSSPPGSSFNYDASGQACLDTLADFIHDNNPEGLTGREWKEKYFEQALGFEHSVWQNGPGVPGPGRFPCGWGIQASCRDLARAGQLFVNEGVLPSAGGGETQLMDRQYAVDARRFAFPGSGTEYGYTTWLNEADPVDAEVASAIGAGDQCVTMSQQHNVVVVSMGSAAPGGCQSWQAVRDHIVSPFHPIWRNTSSHSAVKTTFKTATGEPGQVEIGS